MLRDLLAVRRLGPTALVVLVVVVVVDLAVIGANLMYLTADEPGREATHPVFSDPSWNGEVDNSWMERWGQLQLLGAVVACVLLRIREREALYLVTAVLLGWILLDDMLLIHEEGGGLLARTGVGPVLGLTGNDLGELAVWAVAAVVIGVMYLAAGRHAGPTARRRTRSMLVGFGVLLFFALGIDMVDHVVSPSANSWVQTAMALLESCGELLAITLMLALAIVHVAGVDAPAAKAGADGPAQPPVAVDP
jgi:hypothetical protein